MVLSAAPVAAGELKPSDFALMDRLTWGITTSGAEHLKSLLEPSAGSTNSCTREISPLPAAGRVADRGDARRAQIPVRHRGCFRAAGQSANQVADPEQKKAAQQVYQQAMNDRAKQAAARRSCWRSMRPTSCASA